MKIFETRKSIRGSFSIWDLVAVLVLVTFLGVWFAFTHSGERGRILRCAGNLRALGEATQSYAKDHDDGLPVAAIIVNTNNMTWDVDLYSYLDPSLANARSVYDKRQLMAACQKYFTCPSDPIDRPTPRSYAMAGRDMDYGWPPASNDKTGVGLIWDKDSVAVLHDDDSVKNASNNLDSLPRIKMSLLLDPRKTLLLTEFIDGDNMLGRTTSTVVFSPEEQQRSLAAYDVVFHFKKSNYLLADGHVELLAGKQTTGLDGKSHNIWAIDVGE
jgi:prepilin-type processing-associated H-X9-DG protein